MSEEQNANKPSMTEAAPSEPITPVEQPTAATQETAQEKTAAPVRPSSLAGSKLAALALWVGLGGLALGGYSVWLGQQERDQNGVQTTQMDAVQQQIAALQAAQQSEQEQTASLARRLEPLEQLPTLARFQQQQEQLNQIQAQQQRLGQRVDKVLGTSREAWRLAEAEHLLRLAMVRLTAMQDVASAEVLLSEADSILYQQNDPAAFAAREKLVASLEALRSLPSIDRTGLFLQLAALRGQLAELKTVRPEFATGVEISTNTLQSWWQRGLDEASRYVQIDFGNTESVQPILAGQSLTQVRLALTLSLEQAQWAVLNANEAVYKQSLEQAVELINACFDTDNPSTAALRDRLQKLVQQPVSAELPDLAPALQALQAYITQRQAGGAVKAAPAPAVKAAPVSTNDAEASEPAASDVQPEEAHP